MDDTKSHNFSLPDSVLEPLFVASRISTLNKALERLIETAKTSDGRLDLASKHILSPVLQLCQYPLQLSGQDLFLSIKLVRNLCAGEIKNQNLFIEQNGVGILSTLVTSVRLTCSDNRILPMVLQVLGNVSLAGEQHRLVVWRQFFPHRFLDIARVRSRETGDPLCMVLYTCSEGSDEQLAELFADPGQDIVVEIIQTVTVAGFREDWVKLLLSKICLEEPYFPSIFSKLSRVVETENSDHFSEKAFLLRILSEILNERVGDIVVSTDFSLCIFGILRSAVGIFEFGTRKKLPLPTGSADIDVIGYTLSILRDICACDPKFSNQDEKEDVVDKLVSAGLIKFLIGLLRDLEPPAMIRKATINSDAKNEATLQFSKYCPYRGFRRDVVAVIGNCSYRKKHVQDEIREQDGILLLLQQCVTDEDNPFLREWGFWSMRNILEGNAENQQLVTDLELQKSVDTPEIAGLGLRVEVDPKTRRPKLVNLCSNGWHERIKKLIVHRLNDGANGGPWSFDNLMLMLTQLYPGVVPVTIPIHSLPFGVQIFNLPIGCLNENVGKQLGDCIGSFVEYDPKKSSLVWRSFMRIRVNVDICVPLKRCKKVKLQGGEWSVVEFKYERLGSFCFIVASLTHTERFVRRDSLGRTANLQRNGDPTCEQLLERVRRLAGISGKNDVPGSGGGEVQDSDETSRG
ncbi:hypothetical protein DH2020_013078 [Rehmannia glutinosa]|uniref:Ataxin-10 domain-containing protein n=1 Tax=Rehmannia glutinosa TaxID=99300 RepID=A0ABR0X4N0_REHGL